VRSGQGEARTILLFHIISVGPSKQPRMVRTFLKVYMELGSYFLFLQEQIKDIIIMALDMQKRRSGGQELGAFVSNARNTRAK
jgi:GTPase involved in cell partitioning and DNA repair